MTYSNIHKGIFHSRPNRFVAQVEIDGQVHNCHVKNTGRCELLIPGTEVYLERSNKPARVTMYDLVTAYKGEQLVNIDSQAPNHALREYIQAGNYINNVTYIKPEARYKGSRFDLYIEADNRKIFIEVKGVTLEKDGVALFPDAPTLRGIKHLHELTQSISEGHEAHVVFIVQMKGVKSFAPNWEIHREFGLALAEAHAAGVKISAFDCIVAPNRLVVDKPILVQLEQPGQ